MNPHGFPRWILSPVRLPIPPLSHRVHGFHYIATAVGRPALTLPGHSPESPVAVAGESSEFLVVVLIAYRFKELNGDLRTTSMAAQVSDKSLRHRYLKWSAPRHSDVHRVGCPEMIAMALHPYSARCRLRPRYQLPGHRGRTTTGQHGRQPEISSACVELESPRGDSTRQRDEESLFRDATCGWSQKAGDVCARIQC